jgi:hypothetical protein
MGAPITTVCVGRIDDPDGEKSLPLGPGAVCVWPGGQVWSRCGDRDQEIRTTWFRAENA